MAETSARSRRPQRQRSKLSQTHPAAHLEPAAARAAEAAEQSVDPYPEGTETGRLTIDINRNLRRDLKTWAASQDGTLADVVRAIAKLALAEEESEGQRVVQAAIREEIAARHERDDIRRRTR